MYEERKNNFNFKDALLQLMLIIIFVFIMVWLFPTKKYLDNNYVENNDVDAVVKEHLEGLYGRLFADNLDSMSNAAKGYFTNERLPKKMGDSVTLTLEEMLNKKLVVPFKDSNNKTCKVDKSFVQVTKMTDEYQMKVQLSCSDYEDYVIVYMGCYDYCNECDEKPALPVKPTNPVDPTPVKPKPVDPKPEKPKPVDPEPEKPKPIVKKYEYEYRKQTFNEYSAWGPWSKWIKGTMDNNNLRDVETKTQKEVIGQETIKYIEKEIETKYKEEKTEVIVDSKKAKQRATNGYYSEWVDKGPVSSYYPLRDTDTEKYEYKSEKTTVSCDKSYVCSNRTTYYYIKYERTWIQNYEYYCDKGYELDETNNMCNKKGTITKKIPYEEEVNVEKTKQTPIYGDVAYYRYRTRKQISEAAVLIKWSNSDHDEALLNEGYLLTGKKREA